MVPPCYLRTVHLVVVSEFLDQDSKSILHGPGARRTLRAETKQLAGTDATGSEPRPAWRNSRNLSAEERTMQMKKNADFATGGKKELHAHRNCVEN